MQFIPAIQAGILVPVVQIVSELQIVWDLLEQGLSNAFHRRSTITDAAKKDCQEPNIAADGESMKTEPTARLALAAVIGVAIPAKRTSLSGMTKCSVDSESIGSAPHNIADLVAVPWQGTSEFVQASRRPGADNSFYSASWLLSVRNSRRLGVDLCRLRRLHQGSSQVYSGCRKAFEGSQ